MPELTTTFFGRLAFDADAIINFPEGIPGFEQQRRFIAVEQPATKPLVFLQSIDPGGVCFVTLPVLAVEPNYRLALSAEDLDDLRLAADRQPVVGQEVLCLTVISLAEGEPPTANLLSPIVINLSARIGKQAIQEAGDYNIRHVLPDPEEVKACS